MVMIEFWHAFWCTETKQRAVLGSFVFRVWALGAVRVAAPWDAMVIKRGSLPTSHSSISNHSEMAGLNLITKGYFHYFQASSSERLLLWLQRKQQI